MRSFPAGNDHKSRSFQIGNQLANLAWHLSKPATVQALLPITTPVVSSFNGPHRCERLVAGLASPQTEIARNHACGNEPLENAVPRVPVDRLSSRPQYETARGICSSSLGCFFRARHATDHELFQFSHGIFERLDFQVLGLDL